ncbi:MAG: hypothetical protein ACYS22_06010 [Planctomycetota bacterium]
MPKRRRWTRWAFRGGLFALVLVALVWFGAPLALPSLVASWARKRGIDAKLVRPRLHLSGGFGISAESLTLVPEGDTLGEQVEVRNAEARFRSLGLFGAPAFRSVRAEVDARFVVDPARSGFGRLRTTKKRGPGKPTAIDDISAQLHFTFLGLETSETKAPSMALQVVGQIRDDGILEVAATGEGQGLIERFAFHSGRHVAPASDGEVPLAAPGREASTVPFALQISGIDLASLRSIVAEQGLEPGLNDGRLSARGFVAVRPDGSYRTDVESVEFVDQERNETLLTVEGLRVDTLPYDEAHGLDLTLSRFEAYNPRMSAHRDPDGRLHYLGMRFAPELAAASSEDLTALERIVPNLRLARLRVEGGEILFRDEALERSGPQEIRLEELYVVGHDLVTVPGRGEGAKEASGRLALSYAIRPGIERVAFSGVVGAGRAGSGEVRLHGGFYGIDLTAARPYAREVDVTIGAGRVALRHELHLSGLYLESAHHLLADNVRLFGNGLKREVEGRTIAEILEQVLEEGGGADIEVPVSGDINALEVSVVGTIFRQAVGRPVARAFGALFGGRRRPPLRASSLQLPQGEVDATARKMIVRVATALEEEGKTLILVRPRFDARLVQGRYLAEKAAFRVRDALIAAGAPAAQVGLAAPVPAATEASDDRTMIELTPVR